MQLVFRMLVIGIIMFSFSACEADEDDCTEGFNAMTYNDQAGHSHDFDWTCCDVEAGVAVTYETTPSSVDGHTHMVTVTAEDFAIIGPPDWSPHYIEIDDGHYHNFYIHVPEGVCGHTSK